jgi:hypothetical protein
MGQTTLAALRYITIAESAGAVNVPDSTWNAARRAKWDDEQLANAFAHPGATVFTGYFLNYAQTDLEV